LNEEMSEDGFEAIARELAAQVGCDCAPEPEGGVSGGSIHRSYRWRCGDEPLFVKIAADGGAGLEAEAVGLQALADARAVGVPRMRARGRAGTAAFLALEWIESRPAGAAAERRLGERLAAQHQVTAAEFGFGCDNFIGRTPQPNGWLGDWAEFFRERRLRPQLLLAAGSGFAGLLEEPGARLLESVAALLGGHRPRPSLLHGDLWAGNWLADTRDEPQIFDPAVYYGDREADLAMTRLFGGFGRAFYDAYQSAAPLPAGHAVRAELYNLYHVLNHANLFGGGYARQARASIDRLLAEVRG
jgi:protein-ribulosamine 3-kinase